MQGRGRWVRAVVGAAVVVVAATGAGCDVVDDPAPEVSELPEGGGACPRPGGDLAQEGPVGVPMGAEAVRICQAPGIRWTAPRDLLTSGLDDLAEAVNDLDEEESDICHDDLGRGYLLQFEYADGRAQQVQGATYGCQEVTVGGRTHAGGPGLWDDVVDRLEAQRAASAPPAAPAPPQDCTPSWRRPSSGFGDPEDMERAVLCVEITPDRPADRGTPVPVPDRDLEVLLTDVASGGYADPEPRCAQSGPAVELVGTTAWGDVVAIELGCDRIDSGPGYLGAEASAVVDRLVATVDDPAG